MQKPQKKNKRFINHGMYTKKKKIKKDVDAPPDQTIEEYKANGGKITECEKSISHFFQID